MSPEIITHPMAQYTLHHNHTSPTQKPNLLIGHMICKRAMIWNLFNDLSSESILDETNQKIIVTQVRTTSQILSIHKKSFMIKLLAL